jgi:hypothetical protein
MNKNISKPTNEGNNANLLLAAGVALKWKHSRDTHLKLYEVTDDVKGYEKSIAWYQQVIKGWMQKHSQSVIEAVTNICKQEEDARVKIKFICAGYDLASGVEYACS